MTAVKKELLVNNLTLNWITCPYILWKTFTLDHKMKHFLKRWKDLRKRGQIPSKYKMFSVPQVSIKVLQAFYTYVMLQNNFLKDIFTLIALLTKNLEINNRKTPFNRLADSHKHTHG